MMEDQRPSRLSDQDMVRGKESGRCRGQSSGSEIQSLSYVDSSGSEHSSHMGRPTYILPTCSVVTGYFLASSRLGQAWELRRLTPPLSRVLLSQQVPKKKTTTKREFL